MFGKQCLVFCQNLKFALGFVFLGLVVCGSGGESVLIERLLMNYSVNERPVKNYKDAIGVTVETNNQYGNLLFYLLQNVSKKRESEDKDEIEYL